eukprot:TRINITY_DN5966_c1_g2_i2.p1 TRINITY_DN5966_c1_g2~~TRINITY_DN5966_c1_g2_i2.p1  ORF type:complete len:1485 (+),score=543.11 TRINITY_DN5966_c1_g2_i2:82-4536(+)
MPPKKEQEAVLEPEVGELCFFRNPVEHSWVVGTVLKWDPKAGAVCQAKDNTNPLFKWENSQVVEKLKAEDVLNIKEEILKENVADLLALTVLHDSTILNVLRQRYMNDLIYTNIGAITVALNPFNFKIPHYTDDNMPKYLDEGDRIERNIPHSWATAHNTYWEMRNATFDPINQCILVSGESGAGKTEASKIVMKYLACLSCKEGTDEQKRAGLEVGAKINITSPPLEAFGNAKTVRNDNSSRFGKWMQVKFDADGFLVGADVTKYLLEKSRIVTASPGERCYHSFYVLCRAKERAQWQVSADEDPALLYANTKAGGVSRNKDFDTPEEWAEVNASFAQLGIPAETISAVWGTVAGIMFAENITVEKDGEGSKLSGSAGQWIDQTVAVWGIDRETFAKELLTQTLHTRDGTITKQLNPVQALDGRSALTKTLYDNQFQWLIDTCNAMLDKEVSGGRWVGLLDIFGFEDFEINSFEQLCINLANESLQCHYNNYIFQKDMDECRAEGIDVAEVVFPDNTPCLTMVSGKGGIFAMLDEECALGQGSDNGFLDKVVAACSSKYKKYFTKKQLAKTSFIVHHYAGDVSYEVKGFLDKNRDTLKPEYKLMMRASSDPFIASLLPEPDESAKKKTVGSFFKEQVQALMDKINSTNPHWIRCVKPHPAKKPLFFHGVCTMHQLGSSGVLGTVKIRKAGFPVRIPFQPFCETYRILAVVAGGFDPSDQRGTATKVLEAAGIQSAMGQVGTGRVFLKNDAYIHLEKEKKRVLAGSAAVVQAWCLGLLGGRAVKDLVNEQNRGVIAELRRKAIAALAERRAKEKAERERRAKAEREERERQERTRKEKERQEREEREREEMARRIAEEEMRAKHYDSALRVQKHVRGMLARVRVQRMYLEKLRVRYEAIVEQRIEQQRHAALALDEERLLHEAQHVRELEKERFKRLQSNTMQRMADRRAAERAREEATQLAALAKAQALQRQRSAAEAERAAEQRELQLQRHCQSEARRAEWEDARRRRERALARRSMDSDQRRGDLSAAYAWARADESAHSGGAAPGESVSTLLPVPDALREVLSAAAEDLGQPMGHSGAAARCSRPLGSAALSKRVAQLLLALRARRGDLLDELAANVAAPAEAASASPVAFVAALAAASAGGGAPSLRRLLRRLWGCSALQLDGLCGFTDVPHHSCGEKDRAAYARRVRGQRNTGLHDVAARALVDGDEAVLAKWPRTLAAALALGDEREPEPGRTLYRAAAAADWAGAEQHRRLRQGAALAWLAPASLAESPEEAEARARTARAGSQEVRFAVVGAEDCIPADGGLVLPPFTLLEVLSPPQMLSGGGVALAVRCAPAVIVIPELLELRRAAAEELARAEQRLARVWAQLTAHSRVRSLPSTSRSAARSNRQCEQRAAGALSPEQGRCGFERCKELWAEREHWAQSREVALASSWERVLQRSASPQRGEAARAQPGAPPLPRFQRMLERELVERACSEGA